MVQGPLSCSLKWCVLGLPQYFEISLCCCCIVAKSCPTLCKPMDCSQAALSMDSSGKNTGVGCHLKLGRRFFVSPWMSLFSLHWRRQMPLFYLAPVCPPGAGPIEMLAGNASHQKGRLLQEGFLVFPSWMNLRSLLTVQLWHGRIVHCAFYCVIPRNSACIMEGTVVLVSHATKIMLETLQARLQQYVSCELPDVQAGFRKGRGTRDQIANIHWIIEKAKEF